MNRKPIIVEKGHKHEVFLNYDYLQRIARHPDYRGLCEKIIFDKHGFAITDTIILNNADQKNVLEEISKKFGIKTPIKPDLIISETVLPETISILPDIFQREPFAVTLHYLQQKEKNGAIESQPTDPNNYILLEISRLASLKNQIISGIKECLWFSKDFADDTRRARLSCQIVHKDQDRIFALVDVLAEENVILTKISKYIKTQLHRRFHDKRSEYYKIWDKKNYEGKRFATIAKELNKLTPGNKISPDVVRKRYAAAHRLIFGSNHQYDYIKEKSRAALFGLRFTDMIKQSKNGEDLDPIEKIGTSESYKLETRMLLKDIESVCRQCGNSECYEDVVDISLGYATEANNLDRNCTKLKKYLRQ